MTLAICNWCNGTGIGIRSDKSTYICSSCNGSKTEGCFNPIADLVPRIDKTNSDTNLDGTRFPETFQRLICGNCQGILFEVMYTGDYETSARCPCGVWYIVHSG
jgi:hypothetical protein